MEGLLGIVLFVIFVSAVAMTFIVAQDMTLNSGDTARANFLTEQALEVAASIRDKSFSSLSVGTHGFGKQAGQWRFTGTATTSTGGFTTSLAVSSLAADAVRATATTVWTSRRGGTGTVTLIQDFVDWEKTVGAAGNCATLTTIGTAVETGTPLFNRAARQGETLFVTSETSAGGAGLYLFNLANEASPARLAASFHLGAGGHDLALVGSVLLVLTDDPAAEVKVYNVSTPSSFSASALLTSYNLPGSARGRSLLVQAIGPALETIVLVGAADDASEDQLLALRLHQTLDANGLPVTASFELAGSRHDAGGAVTGLATVSPYLVYASDSMNTSELRTFSLADNGSAVTMAIATGTGANATDIQDGQAVAVAGTGALLGRANGAAIEELLLYPLSLTGAPSASTGPWVHEIGGSVNGLAMDLPGSCAFAATGNPTKELIMLSPSVLKAGGSPERATYNATTGDGRGVTYDFANNRVYLLTNSALHIFRPA